MGRRIYHHVSYVDILKSHPFSGTVVCFFIPWVISKTVILRSALLIPEPAESGPGVLGVVHICMCLYGLYNNGLSLVNNYWSFEELQQYYKE